MWFRYFFMVYLSQYDYMIKFHNFLMCFTIYSELNNFSAELEKYIYISSNNKHKCACSLVVRAQLWFLKGLSLELEHCAALPRRNMPSSSVLF